MDDRTYQTKDGELHRLLLVDDCCVCGGCWVYFDDEHTHGCEVAGPPPAGVVFDQHGRRVDSDEEEER